MSEPITKPRSLAFRIRVAILVVIGICALSQVGRLNRYVIMEGILQSHSPDPEMLHSLLKNSPDAGVAMARTWETGKLPHRWEVINYLNRNLGQRPELVPIVGDLVKEAANDPDLTLSMTALNLLRVIDHPDWRQAVSNALGDPDPDARENGVKVMERAGIPIGRLDTNVFHRPEIRGPGFGHLAFNDFKLRSYPLAQFAGRPVLLHFFATWSPDCVREIPELVRLRKLAPPDLAIVGVSVDAVPGVKHHHAEGEGEHHDCEHCAAVSPDVFKSVERHVILNKYNYPIVFDTNGVATAQLEGSELPVHVLLDSEHRLVRRYAGTRSAEVHEGIVRALLEKTPGESTNSVHMMTDAKERTSKKDQSL